MHASLHMYIYTRVNDIYQWIAGIYHVNIDGSDRAYLQNVTFLFNTDTADHPREVQWISQPHH
jgi:hypothetical protein